MDDESGGVDGGVVVFWVLLVVVGLPFISAFPVAFACLGALVLVVAVGTFAIDHRDKLRRWWNSREPVRRRRTLREIEQLRPTAIAEMRRLDNPDR
jgi:hypothetical protein